MTLRRRLLLPVVVALGGCSGGDATSSGDAATPNDPGAAIVINEISAVGATEWIELANPGTAAVDLSGYALADTDKDTKEPRLEAKMAFPAGTVVGPLERLLVLVSMPEGSAPGPYPKEACLAATDSTCLHATFGVSAAEGESVYLLAPSGTVVGTTAYPASLSIDAASGRTACRIPDLTGEFAACAATPKAANVP